MIAENYVAGLCGAATCPCNGCMTMDCRMTWSDWHMACQDNGPCTLFNSLEACLLPIGGSCTLGYGLACTVTATAY
ncbi:hypothetical protein pmac_cds_867 [Pandoravirus macleodensis]|uniref:Uncharacterized protein n=1 Tax=Pandoravirus macleodensis TaxID=2107707 RepID=A0A2U7UGL8_9VIRU|nr:hypothetical protein pmac_cds_867 [Pandoravirus macleodensis]AVK77555.1 hypothetical protein pmac_cds_867 [Pandoravirus macleodensis]